MQVSQRLDTRLWGLNLAHLTLASFWRPPPLGVWEFQGLLETGAKELDTGGQSPLGLHFALLAQLYGPLRWHSDRRVSCWDGRLEAEEGGGGTNSGMEWKYMNMMSPELHNFSLISFAERVL